MTKITFSETLHLKIGWVNVIESTYYKSHHKPNLSAKQYYNIHGKNQYTLLKISKEVLATISSHLYPQTKYMTLL